MSTTVTETTDQVTKLGRVHMIGIGGAGMSVVARLLAGRGVPVQGSDAAESEALAALRAVREQRGNGLGHPGGRDVRVVHQEAAAGLDPALPTLVVTGGSLGALSLNRAVSGAAAQILAAGAQVLHLTGKGKGDEVRETVAGVDPQRYQVREYLEQMELAYAVADLVVCRSGAGSVAELAALGIPAVYVPLPIGSGT